MKKRISLGNVRKALYIYILIFSAISSWGQATLPFHFNEGRSVISSTVGLIHSGLGNDYNTNSISYNNHNTRLRFDHTNDYLVLHFNSTPGVLSFSIKFNGSGENFPGEFIVEGSVNGSSYSTLYSQGSLASGSIENPEIDNIPQDVRYIRWIYKNKVTGNIGLGNIKLNTLQSPAPVINDIDIVCASSTISNLNIYQDSYRFYESETSEINLSPDYEVTENITLYVSEIVSGVESLRTPVTITVNPIPAAPVLSSEPSVCGSKLLSDLNIYNADHKYYATASAASELPGNHSFSSSTTIYVAQEVNGCASLRTPVTITVNPTPAAPVLSSEPAICGSKLLSDLTLYNTNHKYYAAASAASELPGNHSFSSSTTIYVAQEVNGCASLRTPVTITVNPTPAAPMLPVNNYLCGNTSIYNLDFYNSSQRYYTTAVGGVALEASYLISSAATFFVSQVVNGCESLRSPVSFEVIHLAAPSLQTLVFCGQKTIADLGGNDHYRWYASETSTQVLGPTYIIPESTVLYVSNVLQGCESSKSAVDVIINTKPNAPSVVLPQPFCGTVPVSSLPQGNGTYKWYLTQTATTPFTGALSSSTIVYVSQTINGCESGRTPVSITVINSNFTPSVSTQTFCGSATVADLPQGNGYYRWYATATSDQALGLEVPITGINTFYVATVGVQCESLRKAVAVYVADISAPQVSEITLCKGAKIEEVPITAATNTTIYWYSSFDSQIPLPANTVLSSGIYYIGKLQFGCYSARAEVNVIVNERPSAPTGLNFQSFQMTNDVIFPVISDLQADQPEVTWFSTWSDAMNGTNPLVPSMPLENGRTYFGVLVNEFGCSSQGAFPVTVTITLDNREFNRSELIYYPNPVSDVLNILYDRVIDQVIIYNVKGQRLGVHSFDTENVQLNLGTLSSGIYMLEITIGKEKKFIKIIR